jgi:tetratricopeptide (TPR) repeat protein
MAGVCNVEDWPPELVRLCHEWLGTPEGAVPNHYQLLGVPPFECDQAIIRNGFERQYNFVKQQGGKYLAERESLLGKLAAAHVCLSDPIRKKEYDAQLVRSVPAPAARIAALPEQPSSQPATAPTFAADAPQKASTKWVVVALLVICGLLVLAGWMLHHADHPGVKGASMSSRPARPNETPVPNQQDDSAEQADVPPPPKEGTGRLNLGVAEPPARPAPDVGRQAEPVPANDEPAGAKADGPMARADVPDRGVAANEVHAPQRAGADQAQAGPDADLDAAAPQKDLFTLEEFEALIATCTSDRERCGICGMVADDPTATPEAVARARQMLDELERVMESHRLVDEACALVEGGRAEEARNKLQAANRLAPDRLRPVFVLGLLEALEFRDLPAAQRAFKAALARAPSHPAVLNNLALVELRLGHTSQAVKYLRAALSAAPQMIEAQYNARRLAVHIQRRGVRLQHRDAQWLKSLASAQQGYGRGWLYVDSSVGGDEPSGLRAARNPFEKNWWEDNTCLKCNGLGSLDCPRCANGKVLVREAIGAASYAPQGAAADHRRVGCGMCAGTGRMFCFWCNGSGRE